MTEPLLNITAWEHVGIRVSDKVTAFKFYGALGFEVEGVGPSGYAYELINENGIRLNLIVNAKPQADRFNILLDDDIKYPGVTHPAFIVESLDDVTSKLTSAGIEITEGPNVENRRRYLFIRDPDGNVLEFNEMLAAPKLS